MHEGFFCSSLCTVCASCALYAGCSAKPAANKLWGRRGGSSLIICFQGFPSHFQFGQFLFLSASLHVQARQGVGEGGGKNSSAEGDYEKEDGYGWGGPELLEMLSPFLRASARRRTDVGTCGDRPHMLHPIHRHSGTATMVRLCALGVTKYINLHSPEHRSLLIFHRQ